MITPTLALPHRAERRGLYPGPFWVGHTPTQSEPKTWQCACSPTRREQHITPRGPPAVSALTCPLDPAKLGPTLTPKESEVTQRRVWQPINLRSQTPDILRSCDH